MAASLISQGEVQWITSGVEYNCRNDGRGREDFRELSLQLGVIAQATGSARVQLGETDVIIGVKVRLGLPGRRCQAGVPGWQCCQCCLLTCLPPVPPTSSIAFFGTLRHAG